MFSNDHPVPLLDIAAILLYFPMTTQSKSLMYLLLYSSYVRKKVGGYSSVSGADYFIMLYSTHCVLDTHNF